MGGGTAAFGLPSIGVAGVGGDSATDGVPSTLVGPMRMPGVAGESKLHTSDTDCTFTRTLALELDRSVRRAAEGTRSLGNTTGAGFLEAVARFTCVASRVVEPLSESLRAPPTSFENWCCA